MAKQLFFDIEARNKMKKGVDTLANAVKEKGTDWIRTDNAKAILYTLKIRNIIPF